MVRIVSQGKHHLKLDLSLFGKTCGILPLGTSSAHVTTTGLEWNLGPKDRTFPPSSFFTLSPSPVLTGWTGRYVPHVTFDRRVDFESSRAGGRDGRDGRGGDLDDGGARWG